MATPFVLLPALAGTHGDEPGAVAVAGEQRSWAELALAAGATGAAIVGAFLKLDRDAAHEGTEHLAISEANPYQG